MDDPAAGGGVGVDDVDGPVAVVGDVVVDDDQLARLACGGFEVAEARAGAAVEGDHHVGLAREVVGLGEEPESGQLPVVGRDDERRRERRARGRDPASSRARHRRG